MVYRVSATVQTSFRPTTSDPGPQRRGPTTQRSVGPSMMEKGSQLIPRTYPIKKIDVIRYDTSCVVRNSAAMKRLADEGADEANVLFKVSLQCPLA